MEIDDSLEVLMRISDKLTTIIERLDKIVGLQNQILREVEQIEK